MAYKSLILFVFLCSTSKALAGACCAGGSSQTSLITGDLQAQFNLSYQNGLESYRADERGDIFFITNEENRVREVVNFTGSFVFNEYYQFSLTLPYITNTYESEDVWEQSRGLGDPVLQVSYEFLPELSYSAWKPRGFIFLKRSFSVSNSLYNSKKSYGTDAISLGYAVNSVGLSLFKFTGVWDFNYIVQGFQGESREFSNKQNFTVIPGTALIQNVQVGRHFAKHNIRMAIEVMDFYEGPKTLRGDVKKKSAARSYTAAGLAISYAPGDISYNLGYLDQGVFGRLKNMRANRVISLGINYNIPL